MKKDDCQSRLNQEHIANHRERHVVAVDGGNAVQQIVRLVDDDHVAVQLQPHRIPGTLQPG